MFGCSAPIPGIAAIIRRVKMRDRIAAAPTLDEAQQLAVEPVAQAR
jgi:hypothetical protein